MQRDITIEIVQIIIFFREGQRPKTIVNTQ